MKNLVTIEDVKANMQDVQVQTIMEFDKPTTHVAVKMNNGYIVRSATTCVDPANYDEEIGKKICLEHIEDQIWKLLGYALQERVSNSSDPLKATAYQMMSPDYKERFIAEYKQVSIRYDRLHSMCEKWDNGELNFTPTCPREIYDRQLNCTAEYLSILEERAKLENIELSKY